MKKALVLVAFGIVVLLIGFSANGPARAVVAIGNGYAAPCPTQGANITISGSYMPNCSFAATTPGPSATPSPTATGCGIYSGSWPYTNDTTGCVTAYATFPPTAQAGNIFIAGALGLTGSPTPATPAPAVSSTPYLTINENSAGAINIRNMFDEGTVDNNVNWQQNDQGTMINYLTLQPQSTTTFNGAQAIVIKAVASPPAPVPTCTPGGAAGSPVTYFVKTNYVSNSSTRKGISSPEGTVTCGAAQVLVVAAPAVVAGAVRWTVSVSTTTGTEKEQTQGTPAGQNMALTTLTWVSTDTLAGATSANTVDASTQNITINDSTGAAQAKLNPHGTGLNGGPWEASTTASGTPSFVGPVFTKAGAAVASTYHAAQFTCAFSASTTCALGASYWTNSAVFSSSTSIDGCDFSHTSDTTVAFTFHQTATDTGTVDATASNSETVKGICWGT